MRIEGLMLDRLGLVVALLFPVASHAFGEPDPAFNPTTIARQTCSNSSARPDGGLLVPVAFTPVTGNVAGDTVYGIAKITPPGGLDAHWGNQGIAQVAVAARTTVYMPPGVVALPDGSALHLREHVTRFDSTGALDAAYDRNQLADPVARLRSYAMRNDGDLVVFTWHIRTDPYLGIVYTQALTAIRPDGTRDTAFGSGGYVDLQRDGPFPVAWSTYSDGTVEATFETIDTSGQPRLTLHRYPADFDSSSPAPGVIPASGTANWIDPTLSIDADGRVYLAQGATIALGTGSAQQAGVALYRLTASGQPDMSFGQNGRTFTPAAQPALPAMTVEPTALWRTANGDFEIVFKEDYKPPIVSTIFYGLHLAKVRADGTADPAFQQGMTLEPANWAAVNRLADGRLEYAVTASNQSDCTVKRLLGDPPAEGTMVEYYKASADHYFITLEGAESVLLDETPAGNGWARTGRTFGAWSASQLHGTKRMCRFYGDLAGGPDSHFYTPEGPECDGLRAQDAATPKGQYAWRFEGYAGNVAVPVNGACAPNLTSVYRLYNRGFEKGGVPNHRYTVDASVYAEMQAKGWAGEGVAFCVPPAPNNLSD